MKLNTKKNSKNRLNIVTGLKWIIWTKVNILDIWVDISKYQYLTLLEKERKSSFIYRI